VLSESESAGNKHLSPASLTIEKAISNIRKGLRTEQQSMIDWEHGPLAVSAVPGAGKSTGMAAAVATAIARQYLQSATGFHLPNQGQLVVVTVTRSAAENIKTKIRQFLQSSLSLPPIGFTVYTLHGLALNIANNHPNLSGLDLENVSLILPNKSHYLIRNAVEQWITKHPENYYSLSQGIKFDGEETELLRRQLIIRTEVLPDLASTTIHEAKSLGLLPPDLQQLSKYTTDKYSILKIASELYELYDDLMQQQDFIDYDDMILAALRVLKNPDARKAEQKKVFAIFEDEAQDSSPLQTKLLEILAAKIEDNKIYSSPFNLVRVGDPNQAINSTFTPADPIYFRKFCTSCDKEGRLITMSQAGRSASIIMEAANFTMAWVNSKCAEAQQVLPFCYQKIYPIDINSPQLNVNPQALDKGLELHIPDDIYHTVELLVQKVINLFAREDTSGISTAILVRDNRQGKWLSKVLYPICKQHGIKLYDLAEQEHHSHVPEEVLTLLQFCARPHSPDYLKAALTVMEQRKLIDFQDFNALSIFPEDFLYPGPLAITQPEPIQTAAHLCRSLLHARLKLPLYELISFLGLALNYNQAELATVDKLAERVNKQIAYNASIDTMLITLLDIVNSEHFETVDTENIEVQCTNPGQLTIITMHKAKGLDWDCVFMPFLHDNLIPGKFWVPPHSQFLGDFTLSEVARTQIRSAFNADLLILPNAEEAWTKAKYLKIAEEYRLLYVAITRAKRFLWMSAAKKAPFTWSKPDSLKEQEPCQLFTAIKRYFH